MTYHDIIENNKKISDVYWWPNFAFHSTDVSNAVNILKTGKLYSRIKAEENHLMVNENASRQVIDMTTQQAKSYVRFYFRPLTPTHYYNEGYKHHQIRYDGAKTANMPVPIFFAFNLEKLMQTEKVYFSNFSQAGLGSVKYAGIEKFRQLEFDKIYKSGPAEDELMKYRHAELLYPDEYEIRHSLEAILCRNDVEKETLLRLLYEADQKAYQTYKNRVKICKPDMFEKNGLFIDDIIFQENSINIKFADTSYKRSYERKMMQRNGVDELEDVMVAIELCWKNSRETIYTKSFEILLNYTEPKHLLIKTPTVPRAKSIFIKVLIEGKIIAYVGDSLGSSEII